MLNLVVSHDDDTQAGLALAQGLAYGTGGHGFKADIAGDEILVSVAGEEVFDARLAEPGEVTGAALSGDVEVLVGFRGGLQKPGMMSEDDCVPGPVEAGVL